jgi:uncharacterized protein (DUF1330 family)
MPRALWIAHVNVLNAEKLAAYASAATPVITGPWRGISGPGRGL